MTLARMNQRGGPHPILAPDHANLRAFWTFDDIVGTTVYDETSNNFDGTLVNTPTISAGHTGNGMTTVQASSEHMTMSPAAVNTLNVGAVSMWMKCASSGVDAYSRGAISLADTNDGGNFMTMGTIYIDGAFKAWVYVNNGTAHQYVSDDVAVLDAWQNIIIQSDGTNYGMYIGGVNSTITLRNGTANDGHWFADVASSPNMLALQSMRRLVPEYYNGGIDEVRVFDRILTQPEITALAA